MADSELAVAAANLFERVATLAREDEDLGSCLRDFVEKLSAVITAPAASDDASDAPAAVRVPGATADELKAALLASPAPVSGAPPSRAVPEVSDSDLRLVEDRCRLKAEGARWSAKRQRRMSEGAVFDTEIDPLDREIIEKAKKLTDCFLWMSHPSGPSPADLRLFDDLGGCFEVAADAIGLVRSMLGDEERDDGSFENALNLLAEAQSALRAAVQQVGYNKQDPDQIAVYKWLRMTCATSQIYIPRFMKRDDVAMPDGWPDLGKRIQMLDAEVSDRRQRQKETESALKAIRYHQKFVLNGDKPDPTHDWQKIVKMIDQLVASGMPPSNIDLRELVLPLVERIPEDMDLPENVGLVLREVDRFLATRPAGERDGRTEEPIPEVEKVAEWLKGKALVVIGGEARPHARDKLKDAFGLVEVDWIQTSSHDSVSTFESHIDRPEVALVVLAIRWSSHQFGDVKGYCDRYGKPLVRLPAGYNPNQVAAQIVAQCSDQLQTEE